MSNAVSAAEKEGQQTVTLTIDGRKVETPKGSTVLEAARGAGIYIPTLCDDPDLEPYGACRLCIVEIDGMRGLPTSCTTVAAEGMVVRTDTQKVAQSRRITTELILANHYGSCRTCPMNQDCELLKVARYVGVDEKHFSRLRMGSAKPPFPIDDSNPAFIFNPNKCILCARCVRACHEIAGVGAIDIAFRGNRARITTFGDKGFMESTCQSCGECVAHCPTGALVARQHEQPTREVRTICPYCGVGCSLYLGIRSNKVVSVRGDRESQVNHGMLCVKGRFGVDFANHSERLTKPLIRKEGVGKDGEAKGNSWEAFREATWDEALDLVANTFSRIKGQYGSQSLGVLSSAKLTNEENYMVQRFARTVFATNNVDHCARLCHASTVAGLTASFGTGAMSNSIAEISESDIIFIIGTNTTENHPVIGGYMKRAVDSGKTKLIVADPRRIDLVDRSTYWLRHKPGTDVALLNGIMNWILAKNLHNKKFIEERCEGFDKLEAELKNYSPEQVEKITGVPASDIRSVAEMIGQADRTAFYFAMGITQHTTGTDNVKSVANLAMITGNLGRLGTGVNPLRGQNNVQGACDVGALPNVYPGYQAVADPEIRKRKAIQWGVESMPEQTGMTLTEMIPAANEGKLHGMYIVGENPVISDPNSHHVETALGKMDFVVVQDIFLTETAGFADVVLPATSWAEKDGTFTNTERRVQRVRKALDPIGSCWPDWKITMEIAKRMGINMQFSSPEDIFNQIRRESPIYGGMTYDRIDREGGLQWPCTSLEKPCTKFLFEDGFPRGKGLLTPIKYAPPAEETDKEYPFILTTGRILQHFHTGTMSRRSFSLNALAPKAKLEINPDDAAKIGIKNGDMVSLSSRRGRIAIKAEITERVPVRVVFGSFHYSESPMNKITNDALDPIAKIPEFKVCAVKVEKA